MIKYILTIAFLYPLLALCPKTIPVVSEVPMTENFLYTPLTIIRVAPGEYTQLMIRSDGQGGTQTNTLGLMMNGGVGTQGIFNPVGTNATMVFCISNLHSGAFIDNTGKVWFGGETINNSDNNPYITGNNIYGATVDSSGNTVTGGFSTLATGWQAAEGPSAWFYGIRNSDSTLMACGDLQHGMRGIHGAAGAAGLKWVPVPLPAGEKAKSIMGSINLIILCWSGHVYVIGNSGSYQADLGWGSPSFAQSASSYSSNYDQPNELQYSSAPLAHIRMIAGGLDCNWAVDSSNNFYTWTQFGWRVGHSNSVGADQLNNPTLMNSYLTSYFTLSAIDSVVTDGACQHVLLTNGTIYGWGSTEQATVGNGQQINYNTTSPPFYNGGGNESVGSSVVFNPVQIAPGINNFITVYNGIYYNYYDEAMRADGTLVGWGRNKGCALQTKTVAIDTAATVIEADYPCSWQRPTPTRLFNADTVTQVWRSTSPGCYNACIAGPTTGSPCNTVTPVCYTNHAHLTATASGNTIVLNATASTTTGFLPYVVFSQTAGTATNMAIPDNPVTLTDTLVNVSPGTYTYKVVIQDPNWSADSTTASVTVSSQTRFYVDNVAGSDANSCTLILPCATTAHAISLATSGDTVSLLANDVWNTTIYPITGIVIDSYGSGPDPQINGSITASTWTSMGSGVYETYIPSDRAALNCVTVDGVLAGMGRYPDTGWVVYSNLTSSTLTSSFINLFPYSFTGGTVVIRDEFSNIDTIHVPVVGMNTYTLATSPSILGGRGNGFFMMNHPNTLLTTTRIGSWYNNWAKDSIQMYFGAGGPAGHTVKIAILDTGIYFSGLNNVMVQGIDFEYFNQYHIFCNNVNHIYFDSCRFQFAGNNTVTANNDSAATFRYDTMRYANNNFAYTTGSSSKYAVFKYCLLDSAGMIAGMGQTGASNAYSGIAWGYGFSTFQYNTFLNFGYNALYFAGDSCHILNNFAQNYCMVKADGGGYYTWYPSLPALTYGDTIIGNIAINSGSPGSGIVYNFEDIAFGFYWDNYAPKQFASYNTSAYNASAGMFNHGANNTFTYNNLYGNIFAQFFNAEVASHAITGTIYKHNITGFMGTPLSIAFTTPNNDLNTFCSSCDSNYYLAPIGNVGSLYTLSSVDAGTSRSLASWQSNTGYDAHSSLQNGVLSFVYSVPGATIPLGYNAKDAVGNIFPGVITLPAYSSRTLIQLGCSCLQVPFGNKTIVLP